MLVVVVVGGAGEEGAALRHRHGNRTHVFVKVSLSNICQPPNYRLRLTRRAGPTAKVNVLRLRTRMQTIQRRRCGTRTRGGGGPDFSSRYERVELDTTLFQKKNRLWSPFCSVNKLETLPAAECAWRLLEFSPFVMSHRALVAAPHFQHAGPPLETCNSF